VNCLAGASIVSGPGPAALLRGGRWDDGALAGVFHVTGKFPLTTSSHDIGFRAAR
jgi:hypothetical protein